MWHTLKNVVNSGPEYQTTISDPTAPVRHIKTSYKQPFNIDIPGGLRGDKSIGQDHTLPNSLTVNWPPWVQLLQTFVSMEKASPNLWNSN